MYFCEDVDLMVWEPGVFLEGRFAHQGVVSEASGTLTGTSLVMAEEVLGSVLPGMVGTIALASDAGITQLLEVMAVTDASHATVSALRGRGDETAVPALVNGIVKVTVVTFRPQIGAVGDALLAAIGVASDRVSEASPGSENLAGFRSATVFGVLAAIYRALSDGAEATVATQAKRLFYEKLAHGARRVIAGTVDEDGDGTPETRVRAGVPMVERV